MTTIAVFRIDAAACSCGQDLDGCTREHCPRCGREVRKAA